MSEVDVSGHKRNYKNPNCFLCGKTGKLLYNRQKDRIFDVVGNWDIHHCPQCNMIWLDPLPNDEEIKNYYKSYHTHSISKLRWFLLPTNPIRVNVLRKRYGYQEYERLIENNLIYRLLSNLPPLIEIVGMGILHLDASKKGKLLDVGCGTGQFLFSMKTLGWDVQGVEIDKRAASIAREEYNLNISIGTLMEANYPEMTFDIVTLNHVIEHVLDPIELLTECRRILKPSGRLILITPNIESLGHRLFQENWRGLEVPRHMMIFSMKSLEVCVQRAGFNIEIIKSSERLARDVYNASKEIQYQRKYEEISGLFPSVNYIGGWLFQIFERVINSLLKKVGEEIFLIGGRDD